jgi:hypothetical protein
MPAAGVRPLLIRRASSNASRRDGLALLRDPFGTRAAVDRAHPLAQGHGHPRPRSARARSGRPAGFEPVDGPLFLVCTHGVGTSAAPSAAVRSRRRSPPRSPTDVGEQPRRRRPVRGNLVAFPARPVPRPRPARRGRGVARAYAEGRSPCEHLRGRSCYPMPVQAAEHALRTREDSTASTTSARTHRGRRGVSTSHLPNADGPVLGLRRDRGVGPELPHVPQHRRRTAPAYRTIAIVRRPDLDGTRP